MPETWWPSGANRGPVWTSKPWRLAPPVAADGNGESGKRSDLRFKKLNTRNGLRGSARRCSAHKGERSLSVFCGFTVITEKSTKVLTRKYTCGRWIYTYRSLISSSPSGQGRRGERAEGHPLDKQKLPCRTRRTLRKGKLTRRRGRSQADSPMEQSKVNVAAATEAWRLAAGSRKIGIIECGARKRGVDPDARSRGPRTQTGALWEAGLGGEAAFSDLRNDSHDAIGPAKTLYARFNTGLVQKPDVPRTTPSWLRREA